MWENALAAGITLLGVDVLLIGSLPIPGAAYITRSLCTDADIVSALQILRIMTETGCPLSELKKVLKKYPHQVRIGA